MSTFPPLPPKAPEPPAQMKLRKAMESVHRTAAAHMDAIKAAETAFASMAAQLATEQEVLKDDAEALARERAEIAEERNALYRERGEPPPMEEEEEVPEHPEPEEDARPEHEYMDEHPVEEEEAVPDEEGRPPRGMGARRPEDGRSFDRSRSRDRQGHDGDRKPVRVPAAPPPTDPKVIVQQMVNRLGLDDNATRQIGQFTPDQALNLLEQVGEGVRNPSAFVTTMINRTLQVSGPRGTGGHDDTLDSDIDKMGLDESAARVLRELEPEQARHMLSQVDEGVRNPSAFIMSMANRIMKTPSGGGVPPPPGGPSLVKLVEENVARLRLDESATRMISEVSAEVAMDIIDQIGDDVRNPSAFVMAEVRKAMSGQGKGGGKGGYDKGYEKGGYDRGYDKGGHDKGGYDSGGRKPTQRDLSNQVGDLAKALELDNDCLDALLSINVQESVMILERLASTASNIRNRSAFVFAEVKKRKQAAASAPRHGGTKTVKCKFWAEGRCKNGYDCRFSHD